MANIEQLILWVVIIATGLLLALGYFFGDESLFGKAKGVTDKIKDVVSIGAEQTVGATPTIPEQHRTELAAFHAALDQAAQSPDTNCFVSYPFFSSLGEEGTSLELHYDAQQDQTNVIVYGGAGGKQVVPDQSFVIKSMKPCVVAGKGNSRNVAENFVTHFVRGEILYEPYYLAVDAITVKYNNPLNHLGGNILTVPLFGEEYVNDEGDNFQSNLLFKGRNNEICLFPTNKNSDADEDGIDKQYFSTEQDSFSVLLAQGKLSWCAASSASVEVAAR